MKIIVILLLSFLCSPLFAQLMQKGDSYALTATSPDPAQGHLSGNEFAKQVGILLKKQYPSKVADPRIQLKVFRKAGVIYFQHVWSCKILKTDPGDADYFFDRRGTLLKGNSLKAARSAVQQEIQTSQKVQQLITSFEREFGNHRMPNSFVSESCSELDDSFWCIEEYFIAARKQ